MQWPFSAEKRVHGQDIIVSHDKVRDAHDGRNACWAKLQRFWVPYSAAWTVMDAENVRVMGLTIRKKWIWGPKKSKRVEMQRMTVVLFFLPLCHFGLSPNIAVSLFLGPYRTIHKRRHFDFDIQVIEILILNSPYPVAFDHEHFSNMSKRPRSFGWWSRGRRWYRSLPE